MRHNDYVVVKVCKQCGSDVLAPRHWVGRRKDGTRNKLPVYFTCRHSEKREERRNDQV